MSDTDIILKNIPDPAQNMLLVGHEAERSFLLQQLESGRMHHALLFEGPEGIGKAGLAFHFAYHILAGHGETEMQNSAWRKPYAESPVWRKIGQDSHPSLLYIRRSQDIKTRKLRSAITVDDVRRVSRFLQQTAADSGSRIVIIDSADDMNRNAANALLKTLEEPPNKALFILISHNSGRLLPTVRSRCQHIRFKPLSEHDMRIILSKLAVFQSDDIEAPESEEVIARAEGSVRKALSLLTEHIAEHIHKAESLLKADIFSAPVAQNLAENLGARDNDAAYALFMQAQFDFIYKQARAAAQASRLTVSAAWADFFAGQEQAFLQAQAFNLDKKHFILVFLRQLHHFFHAAKK